MEAVLIVLAILALALAVGHLIARWTWPIRAERWRRRAYLVEYEARHADEPGLDETRPVGPDDEPPPRLLDDEERQRRRAAGRMPEDLDY